MALVLRLGMLKDILLLIKVILLWSKFMSAIMFGLFRDIPMTTLVVFFFSSAEGWSDIVCCCSGNNGKHTIRVTCHSAEAFLYKPQELSLWNNLSISALLKCTIILRHWVSGSEFITLVLMAKFPDYNISICQIGRELETSALPYNPCTLINHSTKSNFCHCALTFILSQICDLFSLVDTIVKAIVSFK